MHNLILEPETEGLTYRYSKIEGLVASVERTLCDVSLQKEKKEVFMYCIV